MAIARTEPGSKWHKTPLCYPASIYLPITYHLSPITILEIGSGRGDFLFYLAENNPNNEIIGIELKSRRYFKLIDRVIERGLKNVKVIQADGREAVAGGLAPESLDEIHVNFPDPWPKRKHTKNRLLSKEFARNCKVILKKGGFLSFITDSKDYADAVFKESSKIEGFKFSREENASVFPTFFAQKWLKDGRKFYMMKWIRS